MKTRDTDKPVIIWYSDPVNPDDTVLLNGYAFGDDCVVKLKCLTDSDKKQAQSETLIKPLEKTENSLKFVIPKDWRMGVYSCVITTKRAASNEILLNAPDIWWCQGDRGVKAKKEPKKSSDKEIGLTSSGGWLRIQGKCLVFDKKPLVCLQDVNHDIPLNVVKSSKYSVEVNIPDELSPGNYRLSYDNGYGVPKNREIEVVPKFVFREMTFNVCDLGADPTGKKDSSVAITDAILHLGAQGGGIVYFPAGRYRVDSIIRSGVFIKTSLKIPRNVTLKGERMELVSLWWPDQKEPLPSLIEGGSDFTIEDLTIYTQGKHSTIITGESNVTINRVRIRANHYYMTVRDGKPHHRRGVEVDYMVGPAIAIWGDNLKVTNCDIYTSAACFDLKHCHGAYMANNTVMAGNFFFFNGCSEVIFENNTFIGNQLTAGGSSSALHMGAIVNRNIFIAHNSISHIYGGDHEAFTFDGHLTAYLGKVKHVDDKKFKLVRDLMPQDFKGAMREIRGGAMFIVDGKGRGQYRWIEDYKDSEVILDSPWQVEPDENSLLSIGGFNGNYLIIGNTMSDTGTAVQLYPPAHECIVAENKILRASNINCLGRLRRFEGSEGGRVELCWYNQFLDNQILEGNGWGGGCAEVDRWIGGETCLNIWGWHVTSRRDEFDALQDAFMTSEELRAFLCETKLRERSIPMVLFNVVRRHIIHNNSSIRVRGRVSELLIEHCEIRNSTKGIRVDSEINFENPEDIGQLFDFDLSDSGTIEELSFLSPDNVLVRGNTCVNVEKEYIGTDIHKNSIRRL